MTSKELEEALGMTRANIRFYEREGLLAPARQENGYRDYSEEDLATLRKIKLLRQLQFDLSDIRALQIGEKVLTAALTEREAAFTRDMADLEAARALCRQMEAEGAGYGDMDAAKYLGELERLSREGTRFPTLQADSLPTVNRPWVRFFARGIDHTLCMFILMVLLLGVLRAPPPGGVFFSLLMSYLAWVLMMFLETLLLATWGYTPGKWLFGLKVRDADGNRLTYSASWDRTVGVFAGGEGYNIPFYDWYRMYRSYQACSEGEPLPWEADTAYTENPKRTLLGAVSVPLTYAVVIGVSLLMTINLYVPKAKGPLTLAEFAESYSATAARYEMRRGFDLDENGNWVDRADDGIVYSDSPTPLSYQVENGILTEVRSELSDMDFLSSGVDMVALITLLGAQEGVNTLNWFSEVEALSERMGGSYEDYTFTYRGLTVTNQVDYSGYELLGDGQYLFPKEGESQTFHQVFTIRIAP